MEDNKNNQGAPSTDNTSALFVSARKKQLQQQEQDRIAAEKEAARLAAEEEVRRLEQEVADRRRQAEEDAKKVEEEAQERRRLAEESRVQEEKDAKIRQLRQQQEQKQQPAKPFVPPTVATPTTGTAPAVAKKSSNEMIQDILQDKKKLGIAIGAVAAILILIIVLATMGGGGSGGYENAYVMEGDPSNGYFNIYNDGTADYTDSTGETYEATWVTDGTYVELTFPDSTYITFEMLDEYTYYEINNGYNFYYYPSLGG